MKGTKEGKKGGSKGQKGGGRKNFKRTGAHGRGRARRCIILARHF